MPPSNCFETGRRSQTQSSVRSFGAETANGCLVLDRRGTTAERREGELERPEDFCLRSSQAHQESSCPLDKDLSWMSAIRNVWSAASPQAKCEDVTGWSAQMYTAFVGVNHSWPGWNALRSLPH